MNFATSKLEFLQRAFGSYDKSNDGINYAFKCPNCCKQNSPKKKLVIRIDNEAYQCWVCGIKGKKLGFLLKKYKPHLIDEYNKISGKKYRIIANASTLSDTYRQINLPHDFIFLATSLHHQDPDVGAVIRYARSRDLTYRDLWYFKLGTSLTGRYRRRLIIPSFDDTGNLNYFVARSIDPENKRKYLNPRISKKDIIFNELNINWKQTLSIVEGPFDLMKCDDNATCLLGSNLEIDYKLFHEIVRNQTQVVLALDPDASKKSHKFAKLLSGYGIEVKMMNIDTHEDVGVMSKQRFLMKKLESLPWNPDDRLFHMIREMQTGSII